MAKSRIAIITGAGSGIGRATAIELAAAGWNCSLVGRRRDRLEETASQMKGGEGLIIDADLTESSAAASIVQRTTAKWGSADRICIDAVVNNAAVLIATPVYAASDADMQRTMETNVIAPARLVREVWPLMAAHQHGRIVNVSSMSSIDPYPRLGVYGMSKAALDGLSRAINNEAGATGILAFSIVLGAVETEMLRSFVSSDELPTSRTHRPQRIAQVIASCVNGERDAEARSPIVVQ